MRQASSSKEASMKRVRRSREEWRAIVAEWQSGGSVTDVAAPRGASKSSLCYWRSEFREEAGAQLDILSSMPAAWVAELLRTLELC